MAVDVIGLVVVIALYVIILVVGIIAARWFQKTRLGGVSDSVTSIVAGRKLHGIVGIFTMTASTVGGGYINGTAESVAAQGLLWTLGPPGIFIGLIIGAMVYARRMRERNYLTMLDPLQEKYGHVMTALLYLATLCGDIFWSAAIMAALGTSMAVIIGIDVVIAVPVSAAVAVIYTMVGQMVSVAYTDIVQMVLIVCGTVLCLPFAFLHESVSDIRTTTDTWIGKWDATFSAAWVDFFVAMILGSIPWQTYFQRVLSMKSPREAQVMTVVAACGALLCAVPPVLVGAIGVSTDWNSTSLGYDPLAAGQASLILPLVMKHLTPRAVAIIGLGSLTAAVMSSIDSSILGSGSMFMHNIYHAVIRTKASNRELLWVQRIAIFVVGAIATALAIFTPSIYGLFYLAADIVYVIVLPQLTAAIYFRRVNAYGSLVGYILGLILRLGAGESTLYLPPFIYYPYYSPVLGQLFPFRLLAAVVTFASLLGVSYGMHFLFSREILPRRLDIFRCCMRDVESQTGKEGTLTGNGETITSDPVKEVQTNLAFQQRPNSEDFDCTKL